MNAERLHAMALVLQKEHASTTIVHRFNALQEALQNLVNQNIPQYQQELVNARGAVLSALTDTRSDSFSPAWRQLLKEMGIEGLCGRELKAKVVDIFQRNQMTPAVALKELAGVKNELKSFDDALNQLIAAFKLFKIGDETLEPGQCEIGMLIPRAGVRNELLEFGHELRELAFVLNTFSEVTTGKPDALEIKTISSTDLTVYLKAGIRIARCTALAIERIVALYKQLMEIKKLRSELITHGVPEKQVAGVEVHANQLMEKGIEELTVEIMQGFHEGKDGGRKNELTTAVRISLNRIANRVDRGYNIEVRAEPLGKVAKEDEDAKKVEAHIQAILSTSKDMQFMRIEGAPILSLPEGEPKPRAKKEPTQQ